MYIFSLSQWEKKPCAFGSLLFQLQSNSMDQTASWEDGSRQVLKKFLPSIEAEESFTKQRLHPQLYFPTQSPFPLIFLQLRGTATVLSRKFLHDPTTSRHFLSFL
jgi:hypothetical protein